MTQSSRIFSGSQGQPWKGGAVALLTAGLLMVGTLSPAQAQEGSWTLVGWNDLGMHCMDADYTVFAILPPYNTIHAQLISPTGDLVTSASGITVTYEAVADRDASINATSVGKTSFWDHVLSLFGVSLAPDQGLAGFDMPGAGNTPRSMVFEPDHEWFTAEGIPLTPFDDSSTKNYYPMMRLKAKDASGAVLASTDVVLPVSDEMDCRSCHASGSGAAAEPGSGWAWDDNPEKDYRLNILRLHDDMHAAKSGFSSALTAAGYSAGGLYASAVSDDQPILCATCHGSNALPGTGIAGIPPLTQAVHARHASVLDPTNGLTLDSIDNRSACYRCHPGSDTRCLRGAMGSAVTADAALAMQCQSCHGSMSAVGSTDRQGWFDEPTCQTCHTGTATHNNGEIRYSSSFVAPGLFRQAVNSTFATKPDVPAPGFSLFRFSTGHGGLQCEACHGSTHAIFPSSHANDNVQNEILQGHKGTLSDCTACHNQAPNTVSGGPHGLHPVGQSWIDGHKDPAEHNPGQCQTCHGSDSRGTVLSRSLGDRTLNTEFGQKNFWQGFQIGCYTCHNGPSNEHANPNRPPSVTDTSATALLGSPVSIPLSASDADGNSLTLRVVSQPAHGLAGLSGTSAIYVADPSFTGADSFTFAAWDGMSDSNLGTVTVNAVGGVVFFDDFESGDLVGWGMIF
jgi:hypothetical protein